ncbi:MAG: sodium/solute symporter [Reichenbachiella sp.]
MEVVEGSLLRWQDVLVIIINLVVMLLIGIYAAKKTKSADSYFLAGRSMPGWVVGISMMASLISANTFLAMPAQTFKEDWRFMPAHFLYIIPAIAAYFIFMPFFRKGHVRSAYEYLELRFSSWARMYAAGAFTLSNLFRVGVILYTVSLAFETMLGIPVIYIIIILGVLISAYTIAGGLEAVIYTDVLQGVSLMAGGIICMPVIANALPGGISQIFNEAFADGKFGVGPTEFNMDDKTMWVIILNLQFAFLQYFGTDQVMVQRYLAIKTDAGAKKGLILGTLLSIPVWFYFAFVGTALYVLYKNYPSEAVAGLQAEAVYPHFILTYLPAGVAGFVIAAILSASMSSIDSALNALSSTVTTDFYRKFQKKEKSEKHFLDVGRWITVFFSVVMVSVAILIDVARAQSILELNLYLFPILSAGLLSLFLLGFFTKSIGSKAAAVATACTVLLVIVWTYIGSESGAQRFPALNEFLPHDFWMGVIPHLFLIGVAFIVSRFLPIDSNKDLKNLTVWK